MKKLLVTALKVAISTAIISYVIVQAKQDHSFADLRGQPKDWGLLGVACLFALLAVSISFVRWFELARAAELRFSLRDAFRLGFLGYLFNFVSLGSVGGDLFKAVFIAREQPDRRSAAVGSVVIDRMVGMCALFLLSSLGVLLTGSYRDEHSPELRVLSFLALIAAAIGATLFALLLLMPPGSSRFSATIAKVPVVGRVILSVLSAMRLYRKRRFSLLTAGLLSLAMHLLVVVMIYTISCALPGERPSFAQHLFIVPLSATAAGLPLPLGALGAFEAALDFLFKTTAHSEQGLAVALSYRFMTVVIAAIGACFYLASRREVSTVLHEAEESQLTIPAG